MSPDRFISVLTLAAAGDQDFPPALRAIRDGLTTDTGRGWALFIIAIATLAIVALLVHALVRGVRRRRRIVANWREFASRMERWELDAPARSLLKELARRDSAENPVRVLEELSAFERAVHRYLKPLCAAGGPRAQQAARAVADLRAELGFAGSEGPAYYSTRELAEGQQLEFAPGGQGEFWGRVAEQREDYLHVAQVEPFPGDIAGRKVAAVFFESNRAYSFDTVVVSADESSRTCVLEHTLDVRSAGARQFHRVRVDKPITFRAAWEEQGVQRTGTLKDLSAGGLALLSPCYYEEGEDVVFHFRPADYLPAADHLGPSLPEQDLTGRIVQVERLAGGRCLQHVSFPELDTPGRGYLFRLVHRLELAARE